MRQDKATDILRNLTDDNAILLKQNDANGSGQNFTISLKERNQEIAQDFQQISVVQSQLLISNEENDKMKTQWAIADSEGE